MLQAGVVILCHGSRGEKAVTEIPRIMQNIADEVKLLLPGGVKMVWAAMQFNHPDLNEAVISLAEDGVQKIIVVPCFLFSGRHITDDIPEMVQELGKKYPEIRFITTEPMGLEKSFTAYIARRIESAAPDVFHHDTEHIVFRNNIEQQSMEIIEKLLPDGLRLSGGEKTVVKRIVHATGDPQIAKQVRFHPEAIESGVSAILSGKPIYTDVRMVEAGISKNLAGRFGCSVHCALAESGTSGQKTGANGTRSAAAFFNIGDNLDGAIIAIGNAPTALFALIELIDKGILPALVVGMPVGFVKAKESKAELTQKSIPFITITGRRGGSPSAAATINALLHLAAETLH